MSRILFVLAIFLGTVSVSEAKILPDNKLHLQDNRLFAANMTQEEFTRAIDEVVEPWRRVATAYGARLSASGNWGSSTVNAYAQKSGTNWSLSFFGGLARRPEVTLDAFKLVVCHELGHLFAGYFYYSNSRNMAAEGAADYFASQACARLIWSDERQTNSTFRAKAPQTIRTACDRSWSTSADRDLCYRTGVAGTSLARLFGALGGGSPPSPETPSTVQVTASSVTHPPAQCRLDTYFQGGLCNRAFDYEFIPGYRNTTTLNGIASEREANLYSCSTADGFQQGIRPRCWFKPKITRRRF